MADLFPNALRKKVQPDPFVSIIISSYNYGAFVRDAVESALSQSYPHKEIIIVDDGSTDDSRLVIGSYHNKATIIFKSNGGQASALNEGFRHCRGDVIIFLDSDDLLHPHLVSTIITHFNAKASKLHWQLQEINANGIPDGKISPSFPLSKGNFINDMLTKGPAAAGGPPYSPPTSGNAWSRFFLQHIMPIDENSYRTSPDQLLHALAPIYGEVIPIHQILGSYRVHGGNYSQKPLHFFAEEFVSRFELTCHFVAEHLHANGYAADPSTWPRNSYYHQVLSAFNFIRELVLPGEHFILIDNDEWGVSKSFENRLRSFLVEKNGFYNGHPADEDDALQSLLDRLKEGARYIFISQTSDWYLEAYSKLSDYLVKHFESIGCNDYVKGFRLISS